MKKTLQKADPLYLFYISSEDSGWLVFQIDFLSSNREDENRIWGFD